MHHSTSDYLRVVNPYIPKGLISNQALSRIQEVASLLPPSSNFGFECKLGSAAPDADFLVAVIPSDGSRSAWCGKNPIATAPPQTRTHPVWKNIHGFFESWEGNEKYSSIFDSWLEFDLDGIAPGVPPPSMFFGFDHNSNESHPDVVMCALQHLAPSVSPSLLENVGRCYAALPIQRQVFQVGLMLARSTNAVRLCIKRIAPGQIIDYLERIHWPGSLEEARRVVDGLAPFTDRIGLDLDVGETVIPRIGLECSIKGKDAGWRQLRSFLSHLVERGVCLPEKAEAIPAWLGYCTDRSDRSRWPPYLLKASERLGPDVMSSFARTLNHIKVGYAPGEPLIAKAYLGVRHFWIHKRTEAQQ